VPKGMDTPDPMEKNEFFSCAMTDAEMKIKIRIATVNGLIFI
jgi:hypothetical protein